MLKKANITKSLEVDQKAEDHLLAIPGVQGVGFGWKEIQGQITDIPAWRVYVSEKIPGTMLPPADLIPGRHAGIPTDVLVLKTGVSVSGSNPGPGALLTVGATLSNLKGVSDGTINKNGGSGLGALGFFAALRGAQNWRNLVLVSNRHVLLAHGARKGDLIYQPEYKQKKWPVSFPKRQTQSHCRNPG